jgi:hypothetical protein
MILFLKVIRSYPFTEGKTIKHKLDVGLRRQR